MKGKKNEFTSPQKLLYWNFVAWNSKLNSQKERERAWKSAPWPPLASCRSLFRQNICSSAGTGGVQPGPRFWKPPIIIIIIRSLSSPEQTRQLTATSEEWRRLCSSVKLQREEAESQEKEWKMRPGRADIRNVFMSGGVSERGGTESPPLVVE